MDTIKLKKQIILLVFMQVAIPLLFTTCEKYEDRTYFKTEGVGYVYNKHTNEPVENARVSVGSAFEHRGYATVQTESERFETDAQGYYRVRFLKRYHKSNVGGYSVCSTAENNKLSATCISFTIDFLKTNSISNTLTLDTLWLQ